MEDKKKTEKTEGILQQDLDQKGDFRNVYMMFLLFEDDTIYPSIEQVKEKLTEKLGEVDIVSDQARLSSFAIKQFPVKYKDASVPAQVLLGDISPIQPDLIGGLEQTQQWDCPEWEEVWNSCRYQLMISDFVAAGLEYKQRCELLISWVEVLMELFPACRGIWNPASGKILTRNQVLNNPYEKEGRFLYLGMNVRSFNIQNTPDSLVDTLGLYAIGLPDIQYHFHDLNPDAVVNHAYNVAFYIFNNEVEIKNDETLPGITNGQMDPVIKWPCQHEKSLIQPARDVLDVCPGEFAAGNRS
ncbi:MAG: DUF4261 domain-containing protein [Tannerellaceae bacterium]|nr:DUF4261 domain-containing protein [Tannerellaceae bacterium]